MESIINADDVSLPALDREGQKLISNSLLDLREVTISWFNVESS